MAIPSIVKWGGTPKIGSFLPIGPINNRYTPNTGICISNSKIYVRVIITELWCSLLGWYSICKELLNKASVNSFQVSASRILYDISENTKQGDNGFE